MLQHNKFFDSIDWWIVGLYALLVIAGWFCIYGASYNFEETVFWDINYRYGKQLLWIGMAVLIGGTILLIDDKIYSTFAYPIYGAFILLLLLTVAVAPDVKGSHSWLVLGPVSLQPAEFAKTATCLALAKAMSAYNYDLFKPRDAATAALIILLPTFIIILQNETGSALVYFSLCIMLYREGMPGIILFIGFCCALFFIVAIRFGEESVIEAFPDESFGIFLVMILALLIHLFLALVYFGDVEYCMRIALVNIVLFGIGIVVYKVFGHPFRFTYLAIASTCISVLTLIFKSLSRWKWGYLWVAGFLVVSSAYAHAANYAFDKVLQPHQQVRIKVTLGMVNDPKKSGYNVNQSKIAIGSGGLNGKGFLNGTQTKLKYVPEQDTDFIFCTVGEEHGFIGSTIVLVLYLVLLLRLIYKSEQQQLTFNRVYGYCVASIMFFHLAINVGMVTGLTPVIGIPLPFFSYGGSSLWGFTIQLFIFLRLDASNKN